MAERGRPKGPDVKDGIAMDLDERHQGLRRGHPVGMEPHRRQGLMRDRRQITECSHRHGGVRRFSESWRADKERRSCHPEIIGRSLKAIPEQVKGLDPA